MLNKRFKLQINGFSLLIALVAWMLVFLWRDSCLLGDGLISYLQPVTSLGLGAALYFWARHVVDEKKADVRLIPFAILGAVVPFAVGELERRIGLGTPWEVLSMVVFANWTILLAMLSRFERYQNLTAIFAGTATFVVISMIEGWKFSLLGGAYGLLVLWWSMTRYWQKLEQKFADDHKSELTVRSSVFLLSLVGMLVVAGLLTLFVSTGALNVRGLSWFSGGDRFSDEYARDGVGQGDGIRAATQNPMTFGPVESDLFMESQQPTLYDVTSEAYGPPQKARRSRAVGIEAELKKESDSRIARSQQATGEFSVARKPRPNARSSSDDKLVNVLFHVKGAVPMLLATETYNHFEDGFWLQLDPPPAQSSRWRRRITDNALYRSVSMDSEWGKPWMKVRSQASSSWFGGWESAAVKIINLRSLRIPAPPALEQFYIDRINREDFFLVGSDDIPQLDNDGSYVPPDTVIHLLSARINLYQALTDPSTELASLAQLDPMNDYLNADFVSPEVADLADQWTQDQSNVWRKIESVVAQLRQNYRLDRVALLPEGETDAARFLIETGAGTDYMFATTAACMFRSLGIPSRVVKGFWVDPANFDRKTGHTGVSGSDVHLWVEVSLDGTHWIPVEPTPGYPLPRYHLTFPQRIALAYYLVRDWLVRNPLVALLIGGGVVVLLWNFRWLINGYQTLAWYLGYWLAPHQVVTRSARLIDARSRLAGIDRPDSMTQARFSGQLAEFLKWEPAERQLVERYATALNRELYHPAASPLSPQAKQVIIQDCRQLVSRIGFRQLKKIKPT